MSFNSDRQAAWAAMVNFGADATAGTGPYAGSNMKMEAVGGVNDEFSASAESQIRELLIGCNVGGLFSKPTQPIYPGQARPKMEDAQEAEGQSNTPPEIEETLTEAQKKSGLLTAAMNDNPAEWAKKCQEATNDAAKANQTGDGYESEGNERVTAMEAYDDSNFRDAIGYSITWNVVAARQSNGLENMLSTLTLDPDQGCVDIEATYQVFHQEPHHKSSGEVQDFKRVMLIETIVDGSLLDEKLTNCIPVVLSDGSKDDSRDKFVDDKIIKHTEYFLENGESVMTAPIKANIEVGLIGLSQLAIANINGDLNNAAQLAPMPRLEDLYFLVTNKNGKQSAIRIKAKNLDRASFTNTPESNIRDIQLHMKVAQLKLDAKTEDTSGNLAEALDFLRDNVDYKQHVVHFGGLVTGSGNLELGNLGVYMSPPQITDVQVRSSTGHTYKEQDADIRKAITDNIKSIEFLGWYADAKRTNIDKMQRGPMVNITSTKERYYVQLGSPISTIFPATEAKSTVDVMGPMTATRIKNDYRGIKRLFEFAELLSTVEMGREVGAPRPELKAIGKWVISPYYKHINLSVLDIMDSERSIQKLEDLQHSILNVIRDELIRGFRDSRYQLALQIQTGNNEAKPTISMLTNQVLGKYLFQLGDTRLLGSLPYPVLADTHASKLLGEYGSDEHELLIVPTIPGSQMNPLHFGHHMWKPELASTLQITRHNESTSREITVQPCNEWHMLCPWMLRFTITDLAAAITGKTARAIQM